MPPLNVLVLTDSEQLRRHAVSWDDLWQRSAVTHPTAQAALIADWVDHFQGISAGPRFRAVIVRQGDRFVAALPLIARTKCRVLSCLDVPGNEWSSAGQLLIDPASDRERVCATLLDSLAKLDTAAFWFASVPVQSAWWQQLVGAARRAGWSVDMRRRYFVGSLPLQPNWSRQQQVLSTGFRKRIRRAVRQLQTRGPLRLHVSQPDSLESVRELMAAGWALEHAGWKGAAGSSVLAHNRARGYLESQAQQLSLKRQLVVGTLEQHGNVLAFEYGWCAKEVYHSYKVAYDERLARQSPGQLLVYYLLKYWCDSQYVRKIDFVGPLDSAVQRWRPRSYAMGRLILAPPRPLGRAVVSAVRWLSTGVPVDCEPDPRPSLDAP